jgi:hypothetical protein
MSKRNDLDRWWWRGLVSLPAIYILRLILVRWLTRPVAFAVSIASIMLLCELIEPTKVISFKGTIVAILLIAIAVFLIATVAYH